MKKILAIILTFALLVGGIYYSAPEAKEVQAETTEAAEKIEYTTEEYTDTSVVNTYLTDKEAPVSASNSDWLFAGWFTDKYCTTSVTAVSDDIATYHAKFVNPDVLNVKLQITKDATPDSSSVNMRMVTSVDSLDYQQVGFEVYYGKEAIQSKEYTKDVEITTVYERIVASSESGVDYNYSPKVVDTDSEYFATATLINIAKDNYGNPFYIKPYWVTYNGVRVYGTSRYVTVMDDAFSTVTTVNIPVKIADSDAYTVVDANDTENVKVANSEVYHDGIYAHLRVAKTAVTSSLTKLNITSGTDTAETFYRNLETEYKGTVATADKTWYTADTSASEFVIATDADLYGFANIDTTDFYKKTIYLVSDIVANNGEASSTAWTPATTDGTSYNWTPIIGSGSFGGTFDGQMHSISGICVKEAPSNGFVGLFAYVNGNGTIKNVELKNSYFYATTQMVGSITAKGTGTYVNIKSSAYINATVVAGGFIGQVNHGTKTRISNCWFAGTVSTSNQYVGGIVGNSIKTGLTISDCLNTGKISSTNTAPFIGGIFGAHGASSLSATISNCLNIGEISTSAATTKGYIGQIYGGNSKSNTMTLTNSYGTKECNVNLVGSNKNKITYTEGSPEVTEITEYGITGFGAFHSTKLDFVNNWAAQDGTTPVPKAFAVKELSTAGVTKADVAWYNEGIAITDENEEITGYTYNIDNTAELFGLGVIVNNAIDDFAGDIVEITTNIDLNPEWDASITFDKKGAPYGPTPPVNEWIPIGTNSDMFKGTFDGTGKIISGLYIDKQVSDRNGTGLFGNTCNVDDTNQMCTIKNFALKNSFMYTNATHNVGGIIGTGEANVSNVYTDIEIYGVNHQNIGGIIGSIGTEQESTEVGQGTTRCTLNNCWYDGLIAYRSGTNQYPQAGGLVGYANWGPSTNASSDVKHEINHCLFTGTINYKYVGKSNTVDARIGGLVGRNNGVNSCIKFVDSVSAGNIELYWGGSVYEEGTITRVGSLMGRDSSTNGAALTIGEHSVYVTSELRPVYNSSNAVVTTNIVENPDWSTGLQNLDANYWAMTSTIPVLKQLINYTDNWAVLP